MWALHGLRLRGGALAALRRHLPQQLREDGPRRRDGRRRTRSQRLWDAIEEDPKLEVVVDVEHKRVAAPAIGLDVAFELDDFTQYRLLNGLDDIGLTLAHADDIDTLRDAPAPLDADRHRLTAPTREPA